MRIGWRMMVAIVVAASAIVFSILHLQFTQPRLEDTLIIYGPKGISGLATALVKAFKNRHPGVNVALISYGMGAIEIANKLVLEKNSPVADVIMGVLILHRLNLNIKPPVVFEGSNLPYPSRR